MDDPVLNGNQHFSFDNVYLGCIPRHCEISKEIVDMNKTMFEPRISTEESEIYHVQFFRQESCGMIL